LGIRGNEEGLGKEGELAWATGVEIVMQVKGRTRGGVGHKGYEVRDETKGEETEGSEIETREDT